MKRIGLSLLAVVMVTGMAGCRSGGVMMKAPSSLERPADNEATVYFYRTRIFNSDGVSYNVFDGEKLVGVLTAGSYIPYRTSAGEHVFMAHAENWTYLKATLAPGHRYFVRWQVYPGILFARGMLLPVTKKTPETFDKALARIKDMNPIMVNPENEERYMAPRREDVRGALEDFQAGRIQFFTLEPEDHD